MEGFLNNSASAQNSTQVGCQNVTDVTVKQLVDDYLSRHRGEFKVLDYRVNTNLSKELNTYLQTNLQNMPGMQMSMIATVAETLLGGDVNGAAVREMARTVFLQSKAETVMPMLNGPVMSRYYQHALLSATIVRMPAGKLDYQMADNLMHNITEDPAYIARINKVQQKMNQDNRETWNKIGQINSAGIAERSKIFSEGQARINKIREETSSIISSTQIGSSDYIQRETSEAIRGVETYNDLINGGTIELDSNYNHAWQLNSGNVILSNDPNLNPNVDMQLDATELQVTQ